MVDFKNVNLTSTETTIHGVYNMIEGNYYKPLLLSNLVIGNINKPSIYAEVSVSGTSYSFSVYGGTITITEEDNVTYTIASINEKKEENN